ncbi:MAG: hypothetical protein DI556_07545 [Rhodovulum sulfidophilum]|uniref:Uncharacterized protein n=1 Tax=Rhodovulum sulfidophilum TaxID=35806 RepID=A0A2W5QG11_RHOSU|nr:MAG: hypothetical protein DI556_07545 [Rhodovulum sulfidophilum]
MHEVLFEVPPALAAGLANGSIQRFGAILKSAETGRIVAHMQETGLGPTLLWRMADFSAGGPLGLVGQAVQVVQNEQIKAAIGVLHQLQLSNMILSGVGIGISAAGFAVVTAKIARLQKGVDDLRDAAERIEREMARGKEDRLDRDLSRLDTACRQVDEAWLLRDGERQWQDAARALHERQGDFYAMAMRERDRHGADTRLFELLVEAWLLATSTRVSAWMASNEMDAALATAREALRDANRLTGMIDYTDLLPRGFTSMPRTERASRLEDARSGTRRFREREDMVESKVVLIRDLIQSGQDGRRFLEAARHEAKTPILLLTSDSRPVG